MNQDLTAFIREDIRALHAYAVADVANDVIKLDAMELPYRFDVDLANELAQELAKAPINCYPNPATCGVQQALRDTFNIMPSADIALGNGSDELIQLLAMLFAKPNATMLAVEPSFVMYKHNAALFGMNYVGVPLNPDFSLNLEATLAAIKQHNPALIFIAYPNNPTGVRFEREQVEAIVQTASGLVVVDEAYGSFSDDSFLPQAGSVENLLVLRTLSKIGFAGLRLGYAAGHPSVMQELAKIVPPYNMNWLSITAAKFALKHYDWIHSKIELLKAERSRMLAALSEMPNTQAFASQANFITVRLPDAVCAFETLKQHKILVKKLHGSHALLDNCLRLTIGTPEQNQQVLAVLKEVV
ncbi:MAG: histidinol-phosphate transaminase [Neisseria sp.]|nr:histidinol-phosphate transaminase [Neisseria sp.]